MFGVWLMSNNKKDGMRCLVYMPNNNTILRGGLKMGTYIRLSKRWQGVIVDGIWTIAIVAGAVTIHWALGEQFSRSASYLLYLLAVLASSLRGGLLQGIFATVLALILSTSILGKWQWLIPSMESVYFFEVLLYLVEGIGISLLAEFYRNGRAALRSSQKRFDILFDAMPVGAMIHHADRVVLANKTLADMFGYTQGEMVGSDPLLMVAPESRPEVGRCMRGEHDSNHQDHALPQGGGEQGNGEAGDVDQEASQTTYRIAGMRRDGTIFSVDMIGKEIDYQGVAMRVTVMRDLTDHLIASQRLEQLSDLLEERVQERTSVLNETVADLRLALDNAHLLDGLLPICSSCKRIRDDEGDWSQVEEYISAHSHVEFSHSICPECLAQLRNEIIERQRQQGDDNALNSTK